MATADLILFGIQSAIKLGVSARQAYVDATAGRAFALPLPEFDAKPNASVAVRYFLDRPAIDRPALVKALLQKAADRERDPSKPELTDDEQELVNAYLEALLLEDGSRQGKVGTDGVLFSDESLRAMVAIRQWQRGADPNPTPLQRVAGTLLEIGVDYFVHVPGALNANAARCQLARLKQVLEKNSPKPEGGPAIDQFMAVWGKAAVVSPNEAACKLVP